MDISFYESFRDLESSVTCVEYVGVGVETHLHQSIEVIAMIEGETEITIGNATFSIRQGEIAFISPFFPHSIRKDERNRYYCLIVSKPYYALYESLYRDQCFNLLRDIEYNRRIFALLNAFQTGDSLLLQGQAYTILGAITSHYRPVKSTYRNVQLIRKIIDYFEENFREPITLETMSRQLGYNKYYLSHFFNRNFHCHFSRYVNLVRLLRVEQTPGNRTEAILSNGFTSLSSYYRLKRRGSGQ